MLNSHDDRLDRTVLTALTYLLVSFALMGLEAPRFSSSIGLCAGRLDFQQSSHCHIRLPSSMIRA